MFRNGRKGKLMDSCSAEIRPQMGALTRWFFVSSVEHKVRKEEEKRLKKRKA